jgi:hypothetical protein
VDIKNTGADDSDGDGDDAGGGDGTDAHASGAARRPGQFKASLQRLGAAAVLFEIAGLPADERRRGASQYLSKMPFANIPPALDGATTDFADYGVKISYSIKDLFQLWDSQNMLAAQSRLNEAAAFFDKISAGLPEARLELSQLEIAAETTGA